MSSCAQSYGSFNKNDAGNMSYLIPANESNFRSYASVVQTNATMPIVNEVQFQQKSSTVIIAKLKSEIATLKLHRSNQTPSTVTDASTPDTATTARLGQVENTIQDVHAWMNKMVTLMCASNVDSSNKPPNPHNHSGNPAIPHPGNLGINQPNAIHSPQQQPAKRKHTRDTPEWPMNPQQLFRESQTNDSGGQGNGHGQQLVPHPYAAYPPLGYANGYPYPLSQPSPSHYQHQHYPPPPYYNQPMLTQEPMQQDTVVGISPSLPAEEAGTYHA
jgi:hypothetical protein